MAGEQSTGTFVRVHGETEALRERFGARVERLTELEAVESPSLPGSRPPRPVGGPTAPPERRGRALVPAGEHGPLAAEPGGDRGGQPVRAARVLRAQADRPRAATGVRRRLPGTAIRRRGDAPARRRRGPADHRHDHQAELRKARRSKPTTSPSSTSSAGATTCWGRVPQGAEPHPGPGQARAADQGPHRQRAVDDPRRRREGRRLRGAAGEERGGHQVRRRPVLHAARAHRGRWSR